MMDLMWNSPEGPLGLLWWSSWARPWPGVQRHTSRAHNIPDVPTRWSWEVGRGLLKSQPHVEDEWASKWRSVIWENSTWALSCSQRGPAIQFQRSQAPSGFRCQRFFRIYNTFPSAMFCKQKPTETRVHSTSDRERLPRKILTICFFCYTQRPATVLAAQYEALHGSAVQQEINRFKSEMMLFMTL